MKSIEIREKFLKFFEDKGHTIRPSASLVPEDDPSVLFTTAGMQQFKPYYVGDKNALKDFGSLNTTSTQKCVRTSDIEEVGDETHLTFFEMLGNFSFGGYFKKKAIEYAHEFITNEMGLEIDYVTVFEGDERVPADDESERIWKSIDSGLEIKKFGKEDNFWGPTGDKGPCGPTTEIYVNGVEIWNVVFNEYYCGKDKNLNPLSQKGVDTGMGLERLVVAMQKVGSVFDTDLFEPIMEKIEELTGETTDVARPLMNGRATSVNEKAKRIVADHIRTAVFIISDGIIPSNTDKGYVLRRIIRRAVRYSDVLGIKHGGLAEMTDVVINQYKSIYGINIGNEIEEEERKFRLTLEKGMREFEKLSGKDHTDVARPYGHRTSIKASIKARSISGKDAFVLFTTYGFPIEMIKELAEEKNIVVDEDGFNKEMVEHKKLSRTASVGKFKGGLADTGEQSIKYHTAMHLLHGALRVVLGEEVVPKGNNITSERLRMDFSYPRKLTDEEKQKVEGLVNEKIEEGLPVTHEEMSIDDARKSGALGVFDDKYEDKVKVYSIGDFNKEICGGPHVENTKEIGKFRITNESASSAGVRRIKAVLSN